MSQAPGTLLDALIGQLRGVASTPDGLARPAAILWTDPDAQWLPLRDALLRAVPELLVLGEFDPTRRTGPAIWLRCVVDRSLDAPRLPEEAVPILYLPRVSRQALTTGEACARELQPLVDLVFRGTLWLQRGGHDWTTTAFLTSPQGLGLDVAKDAATRMALANALRELAVAPLAQLRRGRLEATDFDQLLSADVVGDLLRWMGDPEAGKERLGPERWVALRSRCRDQFGFDPERDGVLKAGEKLGRAEGAWAGVWARFEDAPDAHPGIPDLLRRCHPSLTPAGNWPQHNERLERDLLAGLTDLEGVPHAESCKRVLELEREHARRREWVWAGLGMSPLAMVLEHLAALAAAAQRPLGGTTPDDMARGYVAGPWRADAAALQALATVPVQHEEAVREVVQQLLEPWLMDTSMAFQAAVARTPLVPPEARQPVDAPEGGCLVFVDGLRYDLGRLLGQHLEGQGCTVEVRHRWAALPTVTATGKPAVTPVADAMVGGQLGEDFAPRLRAGKASDAPNLRAAIEERGYQVLAGGRGDWPVRGDARGYLEFGEIDQRGHALGQQLPRDLPEQLERLGNRIARLLDAGWRSVRVVTDHGWLFLPLGLPKVELPKHLTLRRWARCAVVAGASDVPVPLVAWHWNAGQGVAVAPGIACFKAAECYAHGGLSLQEALTPDILVTRGGDRRIRAAIKSITWRGMRCFIEAEVTGGEVRADLRLANAHGDSVVKAPKPLEADGSTSLVLRSDEHERSPLVLVLLAPDHSILAQRETRVGTTS